MMRERIEAIIKANLKPGIHRYGFADLRGLLGPGYGRYPCGISILRRLDPGVVDTASDGPSPAYYAHYGEVNEELGSLVAAISADIAALGVECLAVPPTYHDSQLDSSFHETLRTPISHKMLATRSGLGWIGKTDLLVSREFGPRVRLASVLLGVPVDPCGPPVERSLCGDCDACVRACPARAANGLSWKAGMDRDEFYDAHKCREACKMLSRLRLGEDVSLCGICVSTCPKGKTKRALTAQDGRAYTKAHA